jgi:hypothetical protein
MQFLLEQPNREVAHEFGRNQRLLGARLNGRALLLGRRTFHSRGLALLLGSLLHTLANPNSDARNSIHLPSKIQVILLCLKMRGSVRYLR